MPPKKLLLYDRGTGDSSSALDRTHVCAWRESKASDLLPKLNVSLTVEVTLLIFQTEKSELVTWKKGDVPRIAFRVY